MFSVHWLNKSFPLNNYVLCFLWSFVCPVINFFYYLDLKIVNTHISNQWNLLGTYNILMEIFPTTKPRILVQK